MSASLPYPLYCYAIRWCLLFVLAVGLVPRQDIEDEAMNSPARSWARPLAQDFSTVATVPDDTDAYYTYFLSNAFTRLASGTLVAAAPMIKSGPGVSSDSAVRVARSSDEGDTWSVVANLPFATRVEVALFAHQDLLTMIIGGRQGHGPILVAQSPDEGVTWTEPVEIGRNPNSARTEPSGSDATGKQAWEVPVEASSSDDFWYCLHQTAMVVRDGRLYFAVSEACQKLAITSCDLAKGVMNPEAWRIGPGVEMPIPKELNPGLFPGRSMRCLEGNIIEVNGKLRVLARACIDRYATSNLAAVFDLADDGETLHLEFTQFYPLPGGNGKFFIVHDEQSRLYWMASNPPANSQGVVESPSVLGNDRRFLMLWYALDALNWFPAGCIARTEKLTESFMYPSLVISGEDLLVLSRTSYGYSGKRADERRKNGFHDANLLTLHRVRDFRSLAMNIWPS